MTEISERLKIIEKYHILQLSKNGNTIKEWNSIPQASSELNISKKLIRDACEGISNEAGGYCWKWKHKKVSYSSKNKKIVQLDLNGNFIKEWDNCSVAEKTLTEQSKGGISSCCTGRVKSFHGYRWMFKEDWENGKRD